MQELVSSNSLGIVCGLVLGKPIGILVLSALAVYLKWCRLPSGLTWLHMAGAGILGGIGFTMSIFIANLAFPSQPAAIDASKVAILLSSLIACVMGYGWLRLAR